MSTSHSDLSRSTPESQGVSSNAIRAFIDSVNRDIKFLHSFMFLRHGQVIAEGWWAPYRHDLQHVLFSLSKSFTSTAVGFAVQEGLINLDDTVLSFFPEDAPANPSDNLKAMKLRHILAMGGGQDVDTTERAVTQPEGNWVRGFLSAPVPFEPGTHFVYNSAATYMASAIIQKVTGKTLIEFLTPRLFKPLGIEGAWWESDPRGINVGGWGLNIKTEDIAKFGLLYLQKGVWQDKRLLAEDWIDAATQKQIDNSREPNPDWQQGYGYQFWRCRHNAYRGDGAFGQYCIVVPDQDAVIAITSGVDDMQAVLNKVWEHLLPAMQPAALPEDAASNNALREQLASLSIPLTAGAKTSPAVAKYNGQVFQMPPNPLGIKSARMTFGENHAELTYVNDSGEHAIPIGVGRWLQGKLSLLSGSHPFYQTPFLYAGSGAWTDDNTFLANLVFIETPFVPRLTCSFNGDAFQFDFVFDRFLGPAPHIRLGGKRESVAA